MLYPDEGDYKRLLGAFDGEKTATPRCLSACTGCMCNCRCACKAVEEPTILAGKCACVACNACTCACSCRVSTDPESSFVF